MAEDNQKEMSEGKVAFDIKGYDDKPPTGCLFVKLHMVLDMKMDFTCNAQLVSGGNMTESPSSITSFKRYCEDYISGCSFK